MCIFSFLALHVGDRLLGFPAFRVADQLVEEADTTQVCVDMGAAEVGRVQSARPETGGTTKGSAPLVDGVEVLDLVEAAWKEAVD